MDGNQRNAETFDDAKRLAQEEILAREAAGENSAGQPPAEGSAGAEDQALGGQPPAGAGQPDPQAAQMAQMAQLLAQNQQLAAQNQQLAGMLEELSNKNQNAVLEEALTPPVLDLSELWSEDEDTVKQKQAEYAQSMADFMQRKMMSQLSPLLENAKQGLAERERREALNGLSQIPELAGIMGMTPTLEKIIQSNPALSKADVPIEDKLITAYAIAKGAEAIKNGGQQQRQQPSLEAFVQLYSQNPDLQKRVEAIRAKNAAENAAEFPPMSASSGVFNAALTAREKPKDFEEAKRLALGRLGL
jgi:hypothetical protein